MSEHRSTIEKLYRQARKFKREISGLSQVGEKYNKCKFQRVLDKDGG